MSNGVIGGRPEASGHPTGVIGGRPEISEAYAPFRLPYEGTGIIGGRPETGPGRQPQYWPSMDAEIAAWVDELMGRFAPQDTQSSAPPGGFGRGGGGGGVAGELPGPRFTLSDVLANLDFPGQWQYPSYLRDFGRYLEELITQNPQFAIPTPELGVEGIIPAPEDLDTLEYMETAETYAAAWSDFLNLMLTLPFYQQQSYVGLRYTPETDWYKSGQVPMLPHPEHL